MAGGWRLVQPNWAAMQVQTKVGTWGHNVNCNCDGNRGGNSKCKNNGGHNGKANGNEMNDMLLVLTCDDAKAKRNRPSTGNFRTLGKNMLSLKAGQKRKLGHFKKKEKNGPREQRDMSKVMESFGQMLIVQFEECSELGGNVTVPQ